MKYNLDELFKDDPMRVDCLAQTAQPQKLVWWSLHNDYSEDYIINEIDEGKYIHSEEWYGRKAIDNLLKGKRGHFGPLEHPYISLACGHFPHSVIAQATRHRVASFDCQSMRYSGQRIVKFVEKLIESGDGYNGWLTDFEKLIYLRPVGNYMDRQGKSYEYSLLNRETDRLRAIDALMFYKNSLDMGMAEEHARGLLPYDYRQNFVMTMNLRSLFHFLDMRAKPNAQVEIQYMAHLILPILRDWVPELMDWYESKRLGKGHLAP